MILDRMLLRLHGRVLLLTLAVLLVLALVADFFESARYLHNVEGTTGDVLLYFLCKLPYFVHLLLPISLVVSTFVAFSMLGRSLQLRAVAAAGIGPERMAAPVVLLCLGAVVATVLIGELLVPRSLDRIETLMVERFKHMDYTWRFYRKHRWYQGEGDRIFRVSKSSEKGHVLSGVTLFEMDPEFHLHRRTEGRRLMYKSGTWEGRSVLQREFADGKQVSLERMARTRLDWPETPDRFRTVSGRPKQKTIGELNWTVDEMTSRGLNPTRYRLELHQRFALPLLALGLVLLAFPWLSAPARRQTLAGALTQSVGLIFGAYFLVAMASSAATGGTTSAPVGAWLPPVFVFALALPKWIGLVRGRRLRSAG